MKDFNIFEPMLEHGVDYGNCVVLAKKGDEDSYKQEYTYLGGKPLKYGIDAKRSTESSRMSKASLMVYYKDTETITWKATYIDKKGVYFKKDREKIYIKYF